MSLNDLLVHDRKQTILQDIYVYMCFFLFFIFYEPAQCCVPPSSIF